MKPHELLLVTPALLMLASCLGRQDANQLAGIQQTKDPRAVVQQHIACTDISDVCGRLYEEHGGACLDLTESADAATRAAMRSCAVNDFRAAIAHLPPTADKLTATRGLAEALRIDRDNDADPAVRAKDTTELGALASQLQGMPGGASYGGYYAANNDLNRVLTRNVPASAACGTLKNAQASLPTGNVPGDLEPRLADLRQNLGDAMRNRSCS